MAFTTMHFAAGMIGAGVIGGGLSIILRRGWKWVPVGMTLGGFWALVPDMPRLFREDLPSLPFAGTLGSKTLEKWLHTNGDVFFAHARLDVQPHEFALHGLIIIITLYTASMFGYLYWISRLIKPPKPAAAQAEPKPLARQLRYDHSEQIITPISIDKPNRDPAKDVLARINKEPPRRSG